ncbi:hypothetical protein Q2295_09270 [Leptospira interrogans]|uniref:Uncharacterized protein n=5 Tax=Leptospira interrogans TaxID=173 RepID=A0A0E2D4L2_LEPIR|nr:MULTISPECIES: hypothetical protein [Leptospira]AJR12768.1 hypothetical protein LIL_10166 [Leptospira interrogans serovar Linhai str. 56609]EJO76849.1 hypothetical protein LEP1GSC045_2735 [Leptospira interrogans serovar Pomona str. Kennewicki LC82-25]EKN96296.1 hypothetical protein LEP1GSC014_3235 [Leptospira interrogans serovar Pomona str. Pomona]EKO23587.1 hypothetical protein LEP1GSC104_4370 [Leptospira interrogans str. UI 12621]EKO88948.1 hypothetical protein LEP1GSC009_3033 [Leptospira 
MKQEVLTTIAEKNPILSRDNLDPIVLSDIEEKMIVQIAEYVREQFTTFDWRWDDHSEMHDKAVTSLFLVKNDILQICGKNQSKTQEFIRILEYILEEEFDE